MTASSIDAVLFAQLAEDVTRADLVIIIDAFCADMQRLCPILSAAAGAGDGPGFHRTAHAIAGAAGAVAATTLERAARLAMQDGGQLITQAQTITTLAGQASQTLTGYLATGALTP